MHSQCTPSCELSDWQSGLPRGLPTSNFAETVQAGRRLGFNLQVSAETLKTLKTKKRLFGIQNKLRLKIVLKIDPSFVAFEMWRSDNQPPGPPFLLTNRSPNERVTKMRKTNSLTIQIHFSNVSLLRKYCLLILLFETIKEGKTSKMATRLLCPFRTANFSNVTISVRLRW